MQQRVRRSYRGKNPSSTKQLPILAALHAGSPTLFAHIIHDAEGKVNTYFVNFRDFLRRTAFPCGEARKADAAISFEVFAWVRNEIPTSRSLPRNDKFNRRDGVSVPAAIPGYSSSKAPV